MYKKLVIGVDQSYTRTGITLAADGVRLRTNDVTFKPSDCHSEKRYKVTNKIAHIIKLNKHKATKVIVIVERIRQFSGGSLSMDYIKSTGALIGAIVDVCRLIDVPVYSADTRAWKSSVIGTSKPEANKFNVDPKKWPTIKWFIKHYGEGELLTPVSNRHKNYAKVIDGVKYLYNDDKADSAGLALYGFAQNRTLKREE